MSKRAVTLLALAILIMACAAFFLSKQEGKVISQSQKEDPAGYTHTVKVRKLAGRYRTELSDELPLSTYEFYEGSYPITAATIVWLELDSFSVRFNNGITLDCRWHETNIVWTRH
jgi:hypothetical protein